MKEFPLTLFRSKWSDPKRLLLRDLSEPDPVYPVAFEWHRGQSRFILRQFL